jgi:hypothetical protein
MRRLAGTQRRSSLLRLLLHAVAHIVEAKRCKTEGRGFLRFSVDLILPAAQWLMDLSSGVKAAGSQG